MSLNRFLEAQELVFQDALAELNAGKKISHWMWVIFPQIVGLGSSPTSQHYGIRDLDEAEAYLAHPILGERLIRCVNAVMRHEDKTLDEIFGYPDNLKFCSSMTLFAHVAKDNIYQEAMNAFCGGKLTKEPWRCSEENDSLLCQRSNRCDDPDLDFQTPMIQSPRKV